MLETGDYLSLALWLRRRDRGSWGVVGSVSAVPHPEGILRPDPRNDNVLRELHMSTGDAASSAILSNRASIPSATGRPAKLA